MKTTRTAPNTKTAVVQFPATEFGRREWIKASLALRGWTFGKIAREVGCSRSAPRMALVRPSPRMEREIAARLELAPEVIWPERYAARSARRGGER